MLTTAPSTALLPMDLTNEFLRFFTRIDTLSKPDRRRLLKYLCDGYASASFGYECDQCRTLDESDNMKVLIDHVAKSLGLPEFDHYTLEEVYQRPVQKGEHVQKRADDLISRCRSMGEWASGAWMAKKLAAELAQFYQKGSNRTFWEAVHNNINAQVEKLM